MAVEIKSSSRFRSMLIASAVLAIGLIFIFGIKHLMIQADSGNPTSVEVHTTSR